MLIFLKLLFSSIFSQMLKNAKIFIKLKRHDFFVPFVKKLVFVIVFIIVLFVIVFILIIFIIILIVLVLIVVHKNHPAFTIIVCFWRGDYSLFYIE